MEGEDGADLSPSSPLPPHITAEHSYSLCGDSRPQSPLSHLTGEQGSDAGEAHPIHGLRSQTLRSHTAFMLRSWAAFTDSSFTDCVHAAFMVCVHAAFTDCVHAAFRLTQAFMS